MLLLLLSSLFVLSNGVPMTLQPQKNSVNAKHIKKEFNVSNIKNGFDAKSLIKELVDADPAKIKEVVALVEIMLQDAQADLNRLTTASTSANDAYDVAASNYDAAVVAKTQGVAALNQAEVDAKAAKDVAYGAKTGAQDNLDAEKSRLEGEIASLQQVITILKGLSGACEVHVSSISATAFDDPVFKTLLTDTTAFGSGSLSGYCDNAGAGEGNSYGGNGIHCWDNINDGVYGNGNSWIGNGISTAGIRFSQTSLLQGFQVGRDRNGIYTDRTGNGMKIEYSMSVGASFNTGEWCEVGTVVRSNSISNYYRFDKPFTATAVRITTKHGDCVDELDVYV